MTIYLNFGKNDTVQSASFRKQKLVVISFAFCLSGKTFSGKPRVSAKRPNPKQMPDSMLLATNSLLKKHLRI